jgi:hypothetical protein
MKTIIDLFKEVGEKATILQKEECVKKLIEAGVEVSASGVLSDITGSSISLGRLYGTIYHDGEALRAQLLKFSEGDEVNVTLRPIKAIFWKGEDGLSSAWEFMLVSIVRVRTAQEQIEDWKAKHLAPQKEETSGCFVATAAYGPKDHSVLVLQTYRDRVLGATAYGRFLVSFYQFISPPLAKFIEASNRRRSMARTALSPFVALAQRHLNRRI